MQRVMVYVDGANLYYGLRARGWRRYYWLDLHRLSVNLLQTSQELMGVRYFTARVAPEPSDSDKPARQNAYLEALATLPDLHIHYGYYNTKTQRCQTCGAVWQAYEEKMTDVNIAVELLGDAQDDAFDTAIIVSGDGDLAGPSCPSALSREADGCRVPPGRHSADLRSAATAYLTIGRDVCRDSQLPVQVVKPDDLVLTRPPN